MALLAALSRDRIAPFDITLFEASAIAGPGRAYLADSDSALLNVTALRMSLYSDMPGDFWAWLMATRALGSATSAIKPADYLPRRLFGDYLRHVLADLANRTRLSGRRFDLHHSAVTGAAQTAAGVTLTTADGQSHHGFEKVVLCVGVGGATALPALAGRPNYVEDPYPLRARLSSVDPDAAVVVMGSGLTAVDVVLFLLHNGHKAGITLVSRNGLLPSVRTTAPPPALRYLSQSALRRQLAADPALTLDRLFALFAAELAAVGLTLEDVCADTAPGADFQSRLRRQLAEAERGEALWQPILIKAMHESVERIWHAMPRGDRRRFLDHWHSRFISLLSPIPQQTARRLLAAADAGQLRVARCHPGASPGADFRIPLVEGACTAEVVINTMRPAQAPVPDRAAALVDSLVQGGLARRHPFGGVEIDAASNRLVTAGGQPDPHLFALGQLTSGTHYYTSSMLKISQQADVVAHQLFAAVSSGTPLHPIS